MQRRVVDNPGDRKPLILRDLAGRQPMRARKMNELPVEPEYLAKLGFAQSRRALRDRVEHRLDVSRRA